MNDTKTPAPRARVATRIAEALEAGDILYVAADDAEAEALAEAVRTASAATVVQIPSSDALPGDDAPASPANAGQRVAALRRLRVLQRERRREPFACIVGAEAATRLYPLADAFDTPPPLLEAGAAIDPAALEAQLLESGYVSDDRVDEPGEIALRGEVIDIFAADADGPVRIELAEGGIAAVRSYDPLTQLTVAEIERVEVGPATEPPVGAGVPLFAHLAPAQVAFAAEAADRQARFRKLADEAGAKPVAVTDQAWGEALAGWTRLDWVDDDCEPLPRFAERRAPLAALARLAKPLLADGARLILAGAARDLRFLRPRLCKALGVEVGEVGTWNEARALPPGAAATLAMPVAEGFRCPDLLLVAAADLLGSRAGTDMAGPGVTPGAMMDGADLRIGDVVVHEDHGIAAVAGLEPITDTAGEPGGDAIVLEHAEGARRLVPVEAADRIWRYGADADAVTLDKLDGSSWRKRRGAIDAAIAETARALTDLAAERGARSAPVFAPEPAAYERFAAGFAFTETADQARAIAAVRGDLASGKPMDRLVIGDVGYGKTEVALRAAALVALAGGQVAVAAPTTVLARQHLDLFRRRFDGTGVEVAGLSRWASAAEKNAVKAGLADGTIGVVVGTAAVAGKGVEYQRLGLVIIDEEQRFGAADKARLKGEGDAHLLTMTATPIPRTLQAALVGLQQMSVLATPPARRQPVRTAVDSFDETRVRLALMRERGRGGQSFVVVPRIEDMASLAERLARAAPELTVVEAHGKMPAADLDEAMVGFADGRGDVLLATNIIEAGLDIPRANTMIVWRADRFGLAQLHQLRGRVGRGGRRGQVLLLTDGEARIAERTLKRLRTLQAFDQLGAGFQISARDLDMRGAGDLLGEAQAGHTKLIGVDLYQHLLEGALREARGETVERWSPELHLGVAGAWPPDWIPEAELRVQLYCRLARIEDGAGLDAFEAELEDRFGPLPHAAATLLAVARTRVLARAAGIARVDAGPGAIALTPRGRWNGDADTLGLTAKGDRLILSERIDDPAERLARVQSLLEEIG